MKKLFEQEKESMYKQKMDEIEKLKFEIYNQKISQNELNELQELRVKIKQVTEGEAINHLNPSKSKYSSEEKGV